MPHRGDRHHARRRRTRGQSLAEFALVIPVFLLILTGIFDFGLMLYSRMTVINATREGARSAVTMFKNPYGIEDTVKNATSGAAIGLLTTGDVAVSCIAMSGAYVDGSRTCDFDSTTANNDPKEFDDVQVTSTYVYHSLLGGFFGASINLTSVITLAIE